MSQSQITSFFSQNKKEVVVKKIGNVEEVVKKHHVEEVVKEYRVEEVVKKHQLEEVVKKHHAEEMVRKRKRDEEELEMEACELVLKDEWEEDDSSSLHLYLEDTPMKEEKEPDDEKEQEKTIPVSQVEEQEGREEDLKLKADLQESQRKREVLQGIIDRMEQETTTSLPLPSTPGKSAAGAKSRHPSSPSVTPSKRRLVSFTKLSGLSPSKTPLSPLPPFTFPSLTPSKTGTRVSRNLFCTQEEEVTARTAGLAQAVTEARQVKAKLTPAEVKAKLGNVKLKDLKARLASLGNAKARLPPAASVTARPPASTQVLAPAPTTTPAPQAFSMKLEAPRTPRKCAPSPLKTGVRASPRKVRPPALQATSPATCVATAAQVPAHQRYHSLTQPVDKTLVLPYTYRSRNSRNGLQNLDLQSLGL